jgi:tyrosyl-tRNA synthetase
LEQIEIISGEHAKDPSKRLLQKKLAEEITAFVHGKEELKKSIETTEKLFANQTASAETLSVDDLEGMEGVIKSEFDKNKFSSGIDVVSFLAETNIFPSKGEARKTIQGGGVSINRKKIENVQLAIDKSLLLHEKYILVQKGKKHYYLVKAV